MTRLSDEQRTTTKRLAALVKTWQHCEPNSEHTALLTELLDRRAAADRVAERLLFCMYIYSGYRIGDSRGPNGCMFDALNAVRPDIAAELEDGAITWAQAYGKYFDVETEMAR